MKLKFAISSLIFSLVLLASAGVVSADYQFPSCVAPTGNLKVSYASGIHGIVGRSEEFSGQDSVYDLGDNYLLQCFCPASGSGIQTNWLPVGEETNIEYYQKLGWIYVPDGAAWGLSGSYLAQNLDYSCLGGGGTGGFSEPGPGSAPVCTDTKPSTPTLYSVNRTGSSAVLNWSSSTPVTHYTISYGTAPGQYTYGVPNTGNVTTYQVKALDPSKNYYFSVIAVNGCMPSDPSNTPVGGQVLGAYTGQVLGLASTGTWTQIVLTAIAGAGFLTLAIWAFRKYRV